MTTSIEATNLSKAYRLGESRSLELRQSITRLFRKRRPEPKGNGSHAPGQKFWALRDISFEVPQGQAIGIIGRNGAGKTTLLKILSRITEPTGGKAIINGRVSSLLEVGTGFHPELTGRENIYLNGTILGMRRNEVSSKLEEIVAFSGVEKFLNTPIKHYSSGMKVRLAFSVAAHLNTEVLLIDEVLAVGDVEFQQKCLGKMKDVTGQGNTVIFVSHQMDAVQKFCNRALLLEGGLMIMDDTDVSKVISSYIRQGGKRDMAIWTDDSGNYENPAFIPQEFKIISNGELSSGVVSSDAENEVVIVGQVVDSNPFLEIGIAIHNEMGVTVFTSFMHDVGKEEWPEIRPGQAEFRAPLPQRHLNEGEYRVELIAGIRKRQWYIGPGGKEVSIGFEVRGGLSDSPVWNSKRLGVTAPVIPWESSFSK